MGTVDAEIRIELHILDKNSPYTVVPVEIPYLNKTIEVKIPNNAYVGQRIRVKNMGYAYSYDSRGDLYLIISKIVNENVNNDTRDRKEWETEVMQKIIVVEDNDFREVNRDLENGWIVKEFKPFKDAPYLDVYVLLENQK